MTLQIIFERADLQRVWLANEPDPLWELVLGLQLAQDRTVPAPFAAWRQGLHDRLRGRPDAPTRALALLRTLVARQGPFPDFLTPPGPVTDIDAGCEALAYVPRGRLSPDLRAVFAGRSAPNWVHGLAAGERDRVGELVGAVRAGHDLLVAPSWPEVREAVAFDRARRSRQLTEQGVGALLEGIPGILSWDGRVLRTRYPEPQTLRLGGRGICLLPSYFCWGNPITWIDPELPPVLVYQAVRQDASPRTEVALPERLVALLGRTRSECLRLLLTPRSTTELAQHLGTSLGTASKQAATLREAGLVSSRRRGATVVHGTSPLGVALLVGELPAGSSPG